MANCYGDFETFLYDNSERLFRYLVYKRSYTPYEIDRKYVDQSEFEYDHYRFGFIRECINLAGGEYLLGIHEIIGIEDEDEDDGTLEYYKLSELRLSYDPRDVELLEEE